MKLSRLDYFGGNKQTIISLKAMAYEAARFLKAEVEVFDTLEIFETLKLKNFLMFSFSKILAM